MSDYMGDLSGYYSTPGVGGANPLEVRKNNEKLDLRMEDFLMLMVTELKSQSIDNTADTSEMLNQMVMMQMVSALTNMTDASIMGYAASLVGKTVTVGQYDGNGNLQELVGEVTGTGSMNGQQVVFVGDKYYYMNEIMAVGKLPPKNEATKPEGSVKPEEGVKPENGGELPDTQIEAPQTELPVAPPAEEPQQETPAELHEEFFPSALL